MQSLTVQWQAALRIMGEHKCRPEALTEIRHGMRTSLSCLPIGRDMNPLRAAVPGGVTGASAGVEFTLQSEPRILQSLDPS
jgi:hypothetical protein